MFRLQVIIEDAKAENAEALSSELITEHGFSALIQGPSGNILFDTGQGKAFAPNYDKLFSRDLQVHALCLSHSHYDHVGGLEDVISRYPNIRIYAHPLIFDRCISISGKAVRDISKCDLLSKYKQKFVLTDEFLSVLPDIHLTGEIDIQWQQPPVGNFFHDDDAHTPHRIQEEHALILEKEDGLIVVTGCCHRGVINTLETVYSKFPGQKIHALVGGLHLHQCEDAYIDEVCDYIREKEVALFAGHCTGKQAMKRLKKQLKDQVQPIFCGSVLEF